jgi:hypothetical protein
MSDIEVSWSRRGLIILRATVALLTIVGSVADLGGNAWCESPGHYEGRKGSIEIPKDPPLPPQGAPALRVKTGAEGPFTKEDVENYFTTHNLPRNLTTPKDFGVDTLEFLTNAEVTKRLNGASPGLENQDKIGFVTLKGEFIFAGPRSSKLARFTRAYAAFDARTGNLLMIGTIQ